MVTYDCFYFRVVKSEMAVTIVRLISIFLHDRPNQAGLTMRTSASAAFPADEEGLLLCQWLNLIANVESPSETRLNELQTLTALGIAKCTL